MSSCESQLRRGKLLSFPDQIWTNRTKLYEPSLLCVDGLLIDDSPSAWRTALIELVKNPRSAYTMAQAAARKAALLATGTSTDQLHQATLAVDLAVSARTQALVDGLVAVDSGELVDDVFAGRLLRGELAQD